MNGSKTDFCRDRFLINLLEWDTKFFNVKSAKLVLKDEIFNKDIESIENKISVNKYKFITVVNENNNINNNKIINKLGNVFLADVNVKFEKCININESNNKSAINKKDGKIVISNNVKLNKEILEISKNEFKYSRFFIDNKLINSNSVYMEWAKNSFERKDKYFVYYEYLGKICGFAIFSINESNSSLVIELISIKKEMQNLGIGSSLLSSIERYSKQISINSISVGTQLNNIMAQNFYIKNGFKHVLNNSIYHLWR